MIKQTIQLLAVLALLPLAVSSFAQVEKYLAGTHYTELKAPVNTRDSSRV